VAAINLYLNDARIDNWQQLTESVVTAATTAGWIVSTGTTNRSKWASGVGATAERAASTFDATTYPNGTLDTSLFDCWRSQNTYNGSFASANWVVTGAMRSVTNAGGTGVLHVRLFKGPNANGSGATQITSAIQSSATSGAINTSTDVAVTVTFNPGAFVLNNEYLFIQVAWGRVGAGSNTTSDVHFRTGSAAGTGTRIATADFQPKALMSGASKPGGRRGVSLSLDMVNYASPMRAVGLLSCAVLASFLPLSGVSRSTGSAPGSALTFPAPPATMVPAPARATGRADASSLDVVSYATPSRAEGRATAALTIFGTQDLGGSLSTASGRQPGALLTSKLNGLPTPARVAGRLTASLNSKLPLSGRTLETARLTAPMTFGSGSIALQAQSRSIGRVLPSVVTTRHVAAPSRDVALATAGLNVRLAVTPAPVRSTARSLPALLKAPWSAAPSLNISVAKGLLGLKFDLGGGRILGTGALRTELTFQGNILFDLANKSSSGVKSNVSVISWNHTCTGFGPQRCLAVFVTFKTVTTQFLPTGVTYGGQALTPVGNCATSNANPTFLGCQIWFMLNPPAGTALVTITFNGAIASGHAGGLQINGVHVTAPFTPPTYGNFNGPAAGVGVPTQPGQYALDVLSANLSPALTVGPGQTVLWNIGAAGVQSGAMSFEAATGGTTMMSWALSTGQLSVQFGTAVNPSYLNTPQLTGRDPMSPRALSVSFTNYHYAGPMRASGRASGRLYIRYDASVVMAHPRLGAALRFAGGPTTTMTPGPSRSAMRVITVGSLDIIYYSTPIRLSGRLPGAVIQRVFHTAPMLASGRARTVTTLGMASQYAPSAARHFAPRVMGKAETLHAVGPLKGGACRVTGSLSFAGGPKVIIANAWLRSSPRAQGQLQFSGGPRVSIQGIVRLSSRSSSLPVQGLYYATPSRDPARAIGSIHLRHDVAATIGSGRASGQPFFNAVLKIGLQGRVRAPGRLAGPFGTRQQLVGYVLATGQSRGLLLQRPPLSGVSRDIGAVQCAPMGFSPPNFIQIQGGILRAAPRARGATVRTYAAASPLIGTGVARGSLAQQQGLIGRSVSTGQASGILANAPPTVQDLEGLSHNPARVVGTLPSTFYAASSIQGSGLVLSAILSGKVVLVSVSRSHPHTQAVLAFTGGVLLPVQGRILATVRVRGDLHAVYPPSPILATAWAAGALGTRKSLTSVSREQARLTGTFPDPYRAVSLASGGHAVGIFASALPVSAGGSVGQGRLCGDLTTGGLTPEWIFMAKCRHYIFTAAGHVVIIRARARQYVFRA